MKPKVNKTTEPIRILEHFDRLSSYLLNQNLRNYALFNFGIYTGRRVSDIIALNVKDVAGMDKHGNFRIFERLKIREKKTGKFINLILHNSARRSLGKYLRQRKRDSEKAGKSIAEFMNEPLFKSQKPRKSGEYRLTEKSVWRVLNGAAKACGLREKIGTHSMRKTFGYLLYNSGTSIEAIQKLLNHSSPSVTLAYIGITQDDLDEAILGMDIQNLRVADFEIS